MSLRTVGVKIIADIGDYLGKLREAGRAAKDLGEELSKAARKGDLDKVADGALRVGAALSAAVGAAIYAGARFEQEMSAVAAATGMAGDQLGALRDAALQAGADTQYSASEAAGAITELAKAGVGAADILGGGLTGALALAASGQIDVGEAAEIAASAMTQFGLKGRDMSHIADLLAAGAGKAQGGVIDMAYALKQAGLVASQTGLSIEEATGTLTAFASAGLLGSDAGTSMRTMLLRLAAPTGAAAELMEELGIEAFNAQGEFIGMVEWAGRLEKGLAHMSDEQRQATLAVIFGQDAIRAANVVYAQGAEGIQYWIDAVNEQGFATRQAAAMTDNLMGDVERLTGSLETLFITSSEGANGGLRVLAQIADSLVDAISALPSPLLNTVTVVGGLTGASLLATAAFIKTRAAAAEMNAQLAATGPAGARAAAALSRIGGFLGGPWGIAVTAATIGLGYFMSAQRDAAGAVDELTGTLDEQTGAITRNTRAWIANRLEEDGVLEAAQRLGINLSDLVDVIIEGGDGAKFLTEKMREAGTATLSVSEQANYAEDSMENFALTMLSNDEILLLYKEDAVKVGNALGVLQGDVEKARESWERLNEATNESAPKEDRDRWQRINDAIGQTEQEAKKVDPALRKAADTLGLTADEANGLAEELDGLHKSMRKIVDAAFALTDAQARLEAGVDELTEQIKEQREANVEGAGGFDLATEAGRENYSVLRDIIEAQADLTMETLKATGSTEDAIAVTNDFKSRMAALADQLGIDISQVEAYNEVVAEIERMVTTTLYLDKGAAEDGLHRYIAVINGVPRVVTTQLRVETQYDVSRLVYQTPRRWGGYTEHAQTGLLREAGIFSAQMPARYAFAEPATGGEAFVPRFGDTRRSLSILERAAGWYGATVVPRDVAYGRAGGGGGTVIRYEFGQINITVPVDRLEQLRTVEAFADYLSNMRNNERRRVVVSV